MLSNCVRFTWKYCTTNLNILTFYIVVRAREYHRQHTYKNPFLLRVYNLLIALEFDSDRALTIKESFGKPLFSPSFKSFCRNHYNAPCRFTVRFEGLHIVCARVLHTYVYNNMYTDRKPLLLRQEFNSNCSKF